MIEGIPFDVWSVGLVALHMWAFHWYEDHIRDLGHYWIEKVYPLLFEAIQMPNFVNLLQQTYPRAAIKSREISQALNLVQGTMRYQPKDRPQISDVLRHPVVSKETEAGLFKPDRIWTVKLNVGPKSSGTGWWDKEWWQMHQTEIKKYLVEAEDATDVTSEVKWFGDYFENAFCTGADDQAAGDTSGKMDVAENITDDNWAYFDEAFPDAAFDIVAGESHVTENWAHFENFNGRVDFHEDITRCNNGNESHPIPSPVYAQTEDDVKLCLENIISTVEANDRKIASPACSQVSDDVKLCLEDIISTVEANDRKIASPACSQVSDDAKTYMEGILKAIEAPDPPVSSVNTPETVEKVDPSHPDVICGIEARGDTAPTFPFNDSLVMSTDIGGSAGGLSGLEENVGKEIFEKEKKKANHRKTFRKIFPRWFSFNRTRKKEK